MHLRKFLLFLFLGLALSPPGFGQTSPQTFTGTGCTRPIDVSKQATIGIQITGSWSGTIQPEVSISGQAAVNVQVTPSTSSTAQSTITGNGIFTANVSGYSSFLLCGNTVTGNATAYFNVTQTSSGGKGGGGGGGPPTGAAGGDLSGTYPNPGVAQVNGAAVPTSAGLLGSNGSNQLVAATSIPSATTATTQATSDNSTKVASTAFVRSLFPSSTPFISIPVVGTNQGNLFTSTANRAFLFGITGSPVPISASAVGYNVGTTADNTSATYDIGYYTGTSGGTCTLLADIGPTAGTTFAPATSTFHSVAFAQGTVLIPAGRIYLATTTSQTGTPATIFGTSANPNNLGEASFTITTGGTLPATTTCPTDINSGSGGPSGNSTPWFSAH